MARSISFEDLATVVYVWVDDWYQAHAAGGRQGQAGAKPRFSDSEVITLLLLMDFLPFPGETQFLGFVRANHRALFPYLPGQSQFNRRARPLWPWVEALRRHWAEALGATRTSLYLLDTKPLSVVGYTRDKLILWEVVMQGRRRLRPEVRKLLWHLVECWHELVRSQGNPKVPASTNRSDTRRVRFTPRTRLRREPSPSCA